MDPLNSNVKPSRRPSEEVHVVGLGQACLDFLGVAPFYPREDGKLELTEIHLKCGGPASTALVTLSRLGISTSFLGSISDDFAGSEILKNLRAEKVDTSYLRIAPGYTSQVAFIAVSEETGKRTIFWHRGSVPHLRPADIDLHRFHRARVLHVDGLMIEAALEAARQAKSLGLTVVMDAGTLREGSMELVPLVDVLIASEMFSKAVAGNRVTHEAALAALRRLGPRDVIVTLGEKGSVGLGNQGMIRQKAFRVTVADTTGAGDVYHGGYIYGLLMGWEMPECMRFASAVAALKCTRIGAQTGIPGLQAVQRFLDAGEPPAA
jgi:sulfofructose kinase